MATSPSNEKSTIFGIRTFTVNHSRVTPDKALAVAIFPELEIKFLREMEHSVIVFLIHYGFKLSILSNSFRTFERLLQTFNKHRKT